MTTTDDSDAPRKPAASQRAWDDAAERRDVDVAVTIAERGESMLGLSLLLLYGIDLRQ